MPNLHKIGGVTAWARIAGLCGPVCTPLSSRTMPEVSARVTAATPNADLVEYMDWWTGLYEEPFRVGKREMIISDEPRFGLEPSKAVRKARDIS